MPDEHAVAQMRVIVHRQDRPWMKLRVAETPDGRRTHTACPGRTRQAGQVILCDWAAMTRQQRWPGSHRSCRSSLSRACHSGRSTIQSSAGPRPCPDGLAAKSQRWTGPLLRHTAFSSFDRGLMAKRCRMAHRQAAFRHRFLQMAKAQRVAGISLHAHPVHIERDMQTPDQLFQGRLKQRLHQSNSLDFYRLKLPDAPYCDRTGARRSLNLREFSCPQIRGASPG